LEPLCKTAKPDKNYVPKELISNQAIVKVIAAVDRMFY
jgi:hypothetical protein